MSFWKKALQYFGLSEEEEIEEENYDDIGEDTNSLIDQAFQPASSVRKVERRNRETNQEDEEEEEERLAVARLRSVPKPSSRVYLVEPSIYNDVQQVGDKIRAATPVLLNLRYANQEASKRIIDFISGLTYGLNGSIQKVGDKIFLVIPENVVISESEKRRLREKGYLKPL